jgi:hypothetical protein
MMWKGWLGGGQGSHTAVLHTAAGESVWTPGAASETTHARAGV